jgi:hypothetical protein
MAMRRLTHKSFTSTTLDMLKVKSYEAIAEEVRQEAEAYIEQVGAENVVSVTENAWQNLAVVVWHYTS